MWGTQMSRSTRRGRRGPPPPPAPPPSGPPLGPRRAALDERRKKRRLQSTAFGAGAVAFVTVIAIIAAIVLATSDDDGTGAPVVTPGDAGPDTVTTTLLFGTREDEGGRQHAVWLALVSFDSERDRGAVVYIPAHTAAEIPGRGLHGLGTSLATGGVPLLLASAENLLGAHIDRYLELSDRDARVLFEATGQLSVDVPAEVRVPAGKNRARLLFTQGPQRLSSSFLVQLLFVVGLDGDDAELGTRHLAFWDAFFASFAENPSGLAKSVESAGPALAESDTSPADHARFFANLARLGQEDRLLTTLPVEQVTPPGGEELYETDRDDLSALMAEAVGPDAARDDDIEVQILNGNGVPGIGQEVAQRLIGQGFRVLLTGNAPRLDYDKTLIVTYDRSTQGQEAARKARELLGVGEVQVSAQSQGIVDLTIVVGRDFLRVR
jgi:hypothetical protein